MRQGKGYFYFEYSNFKMIFSFTLCMHKVKMFNQDNHNKEIMLYSDF